MKTAYFINIRNMHVATPRRWFGLGRGREEERREMLENRPQPEPGIRGWAPLLHELTPVAMKLATAGVLKKMLKNRNRWFQKKRKWWEWK